MATNASPATLSVDAHLPLSWRAVSVEAAEELRSHVLDLAVTRSWRATSETVPADMSDETRYLLQRFQKLEEKIDRVSRLIRGKDEPSLQVRALHLGPESASLRLIDEETPPSPGTYVELHILLPGADAEETLILGRAGPSSGNGAASIDVDFVCIAQDQTDRLVRYLLNRQRLEKSQRPLK
jgi:hypothetical protein